MLTQSSAVQVDLLTFNLARQCYGVDVHMVREIRGWSIATPMPHAPQSMAGMINLRGTVLPVLDLGIRLGFEPQIRHARNVIIVVAYQEQLIGLLVDAVLDIVTTQTADWQTPPKLHHPDTPQLIQALVSYEDHLLRILDLARVLQPDGLAA